MRGVVIAVVMVVALGSACGTGDDGSGASPVAPVTSIGTADALARQGLQMCSDLPTPGPVATTTTTMSSPTPSVSARDMSTTAVLLADTNPDVFAGVRWDGTAGQYVFDAVDVASAQTIIDTGLPPGTSYRIEQAPRSSSEMRMLRDQLMMLRLDTVWSTGSRSWDGIVEIRISSVDDDALTVIADTFADDRDAICLRVEAEPVIVPPIGSSPPGFEQTTTTFGPTPTFDLEALDTTSPEIGDWLIYGVAVRDGDIHGFAAFTPIGAVSVGYNGCFQFSGRPIDTDGLTQVVPIQGGNSGGVVCDRTPSTDTYSRVVECLQIGCRLDVEGDVMRLSTRDGERVADLIRTPDGIPPPVTATAPSSSTLTAASDEFDVESGWVAFRTDLFDAFDQLGLESVGGDHEIRGSLSHVFEEPGGKMVQVGAVADVYSPPGEPAEVGTVIIAGTEAVLIDRGSRSGPWFRCRGVGISIESADSEYAIITARSLVDILDC